MARNLPILGEKLKHPIDMHMIFSNIDHNIYATMNDFRTDISLMWNNIRLFSGNNSHPAIQVNKLEQDLSYVWQPQENVDLLKV